MFSIVLLKNISYLLFCHNRFSYNQTVSFSTFFSSFLTMPDMFFPRFLADFCYFKSDIYRYNSFLFYCIFTADYASFRIVCWPRKIIPVISFLKSLLRCIYTVEEVDNIMDLLYSAWHIGESVLQPSSTVNVGCTLSHPSFLFKSYD